MKIAFFEVKEKQKDFFSKFLPDFDLVFLEERLDVAHAPLVKDADILSDFTSSLINKDIIDMMPELKLITTRSTGFDHIDVAYANSKGIKVCNVPAYGSETVAEFTFALILALSRRIIEAERSLKENGEYSKTETLQGFDLDKKTLGVVGTGKIGKNVIKIARGFNMNIVAYDLYPDENFAKENNFSYVTLNEVLGNADIVTLHAPYTKENHHMINKENISLFKKGAYFINTARGDLVDTKALESALQKGILAGVGLDVLEGERDIKKGDPIPLLGLHNVIMTPHTAFNTREAEMRILETTVSNIKSFIAGSPVNLVK